MYILYDRTGLFPFTMPFSDDPCSPDENYCPSVTCGERDNCPINYDNCPSNEAPPCPDLNYCRDVFNWLREECPMEEDC